MKVFATDIKDKKVFNRIGCTYYQVYADHDNHIYVYDIINQDGIHRGYEVVKGLKRKNPDGSTVYVYPSDEQFGIYGFATIGTESTYDTEMTQVLGKVQILQNRRHS
mgnify:CR=1 FL=1